MKKILYILSFFLIWDECVINAQSYKDFLAVNKSEIFNERFDNNTNDWILDNLWIKGNIENGVYEISCRNYQRQTGLSYRPIIFDLTKDYELEAAIKIINGAGGLAFGINNKFDHYRIEISDNHNLVVVKNTPSRGQNQKIFSTSVATSIKPDSYNKITIRKIKDETCIFFNENLIGNFKNINPEGTQVGFNVDLNSKISADYLTLAYISEKRVNTVIDGSNKQIIAAAAPNQLSPNDHSAIIKDIPLEIIWVSPSGSHTLLDSYFPRVRAKIKSDSEIKSVLFYVNDASIGEGEIKVSPDENGTFIVEKTVNLNPGENNIYFVATNKEGTSKSDIRYFSNPPADPPVIKWGNPALDNVIVMSDNISVEAIINSSTELKSATILVNGTPIGESRVFKNSDTDKSEYKWQHNVILKEGENSIYIVATNVAGSTTSEKRTIKFLTSVAESRIALVIGNADYGDNTILKNPVNDANLMDATLKELGFEVIKRTNATLGEMKEAVREFCKKMGAYNVALFYYAGHGIQMDGVNYLIPTDATLKEPSDCKFEAMGVDFVTDEFGKYPDNTNIVILDACRNNPYRSFTRGGQEGFRVMNPTSGTIISFATAAGSTAIDGTGANGLFTEELVKQMRVPQPIESVFKKTRVEVKKRSKDLQTPMEWTNLNGEFYF
ncbi:MAG: caspase family protein, partial [Methanococcaceae archaeon]